MLDQVSVEPSNLDNLAFDSVGLLAGTFSLRLERRQTGFEPVAFVPCLDLAAESAELAVAAFEPFSVVVTN